jgi:hypothetical protein
MLTARERREGLEEKGIAKYVVTNFQSRHIPLEGGDDIARIGAEREQNVQGRLSRFKLLKSF